ncbi:MAG: hypothetical protein J6V92_07270 [Bacteroidaceae bacterium]|nr:hypothetical protein [Bacteroidaceae bacterium]
MKKTYFSPESLVVRVAPFSVLTVSNPNVTINTEDTIDAGSVQTKEATSDTNIWDDEW